MHIKHKLSLVDLFNCESCIGILTFLCTVDCVYQHIFDLNTFHSEDKDWAWFLIVALIYHYFVYRRQDDAI